jgi:hypothetical protein
MLGWPNHPIGGGRPPRLAWGGSATPRPADLGAAESTLVAQGVVQPPLGPNAQKQSERLAQGAAKPPWATGGGSAAPRRLAWVWPNHPRPNGVAGHHLWGGSATPAYFYFLFLKKCDGGILGINRLNCHNLKVWGGKVSHFKLWKQK